MHRLLFAAAIGIATGTAALAEEVWGSAALNKCLAQAGESDTEIAGCAQEEFDRNDTALNTAYAMKMKEADAPFATALRASQRAWLTYRDRTCDAEGAVFSGGTLEKVTYGMCEARLTGERVKWLKDVGNTP